MSSASATVRVNAARDRLEQLCELERWHEALPLASRLVGEDPEGDTTWCLLARCLLGLGRPAQALDAARRATSLAPDQEWPHRLASYAASCLGRHDESVHAAREAVRLEPGLWQTHARLAGAAGQHPQGGAEAAIAADRALALAPYEPQAQLILGSVAAGQGRREVAERAYRNALALDPQDAGAHHLLAALHLRHRRWPTGPGELARAAAGFATALSVDPSSRISRHSLELTLRVFLGRTAYFLFLTSYVSLLFGTGPSTADRLLPIALLALPIIFAAGFLRGLSRQVRTYLGRLLRRGTTAVAVGLALGSVVLGVAGAVAPQSGRLLLALAAALLALTARLALQPGTRRLLRTRPALERP